MSKKAQNAKITPETSSQVDAMVSHKQRHIILHKHLNELTADFITHTRKLPSETTLMEFLEWSNKQQQNPDE